ncbi:alpha/beta fold hydrolase [Nocardioides sp. zg-536]|uniref:Alpha/beta fold hydrolase n=1 Tax=Nocardioides faecalis TaxID=2803858 RepID=A0A938Y742_9ACTN|nr:alpha/beta fold hydrolase [Nocardioides faecalis]MBM9461298.1 alpha/beta fold hydrolase [Nocardioides faecalis]QVI57688.1 alpha/beta fold hydrolase [Nocardioides faecalis]
MTLHHTALGSAGSRVVFLHGLFGQGKNWTSIAKGLAEEHRVLLVDLPHHGRSPWSESFDYLEVAEQVAATIAESGEGPVALVGHSLGGKAAMVTALVHPELVERLCVADIAPVAYGAHREFVDFVAAMQAVDLAKVERRSDAEDQLRDAVPDETVRSFLLQNLRRDARAASGWGWQVNLEVLGRDLEEISGWPAERLAHTAPYDGPVLWLAGGRSGYVRPENDAAMDRWFPRNRKVTIKEAGHWLHSEQPEIFLEVLRRFLGDQPQS